MDEAAVPQRDLDMWNWGGLTPIGRGEYLKREGRRSSVPLGPEGGPVLRCCFGADDAVVVLRGQSGTVERYSRRDDEWSKSPELLNTTATAPGPADIALGGALYLLYAAEGRVVAVSAAGGSVEREWRVPKWGPVTACNIGCAAPEDGGDDLVFVLCRQMARLAVLHTNTGAWDVVELREAAGADTVKLGTRGSFCVDARAGTLLVADADGGRILEVDSTTGTALDLWGADGREEDERPRDPVGVAVYRVRDGIRPQHYSDDARMVLGLDPAGVCPRQVLAADGSGGRVWRLTQWPKHPSVGSLAGADHYEVLLGGARQEGLRRDASDGVNLSSIVTIERPSGVAVSPDGRLAVVDNDGTRVRVLTPATCRKERTIESGRQYGGAPTEQEIRDGAKRHNVPITS